MRKTMTEKEIERSCNRLLLDSFLVFLMKKRVFLCNMNDKAEFNNEVNEYDLVDEFLNKNA